MRFREVFRYEFQYRLRSPSTWFYAVFLFLLAGWMFLATSDGDGFVNAPVRLMGGMSLVASVGMVVTAALFGGAAARDFQTGMDPLLFTTSLRKIDFLGGRFLAAFAINAIVAIAIPVSFLVATLIFGSNEGMVGPVRAAAFLQPYALMVLPNMLLSGAVLFTVGALSRQIVPVYLSAIGLFISYIVAMNVPVHVDTPALSILTDPLAIGTLQEMTKYWPEAEQNTRLIGFPVRILSNRAFWMLVASAVLLVLHQRFRFAHAGVGGRRSRKNPVDAPVAPTRLRSIAVPRVTGAFSPRMTMRQTLSVARRALSEVTSSLWFYVVLAACVVITFMAGWKVDQGAFDGSTWPETLVMAGTVLSTQAIPVILYALTALFAGEMVWKDRESNVEEIGDAAPVSEGVTLLGRFMALCALVAMFELALMTGGIAIQALQGYYNFEPSLYVKILLGLNLIDYIIFAALALTVQVIVNQKYVAHVVLILLFVAVSTLRMLGWIEHRMFLYGVSPSWTYSDMNGFGPFLVPALSFRAYWLACAMCLLVVATLFWIRGRDTLFVKRFSVARARFAGTVVRASALAVMLVVATGGFVFYNTNVLNEYHPAKERGAPAANYEKRYKRFENAPQPTITDADLRIELYPDSSGLDVRGTYRLVNKSASPVDSIHVFFADPKLDVHSLSFDRAAKALVVDSEVNYRIFALERALAPGDSVQLSFDYSMRQHGFSHDEVQTKVVANGTHMHRGLLPMIGYQPVFELTGGDARKEQSLPPRARTPGPEVAATLTRREGVRDADLVNIHTVIGTSSDQKAITPGILRRSWSENGRRYFEYQTPVPTRFAANVFSARYAVREDKWRDVTLQVWHHPAHTYVLDRTVKAMKASLDYYTANFGAYPNSELRIVEFPRYGGFGIAYPHTIGFAEDYFLGRVGEGEVDHPFFGAAHEIAHQWWGGMVRGAPVRGAGLLSESLANYSAMMVTEKTYGAKAAWHIYDFQMERYLNGRADQGREVPLLDVEGQPYIEYRKGAIALYTLRDMIGEDSVNAALRRYVAKFRGANPPFPTSRDLYAELRAVTPDSLQSILVDWFEHVTLWNVAASNARVEKIGNAYRVTLDVTAGKVHADGKGNTADAPMNDLVEIGVFGAGRDGQRGDALYLQRHRIHNGKQTITITVSNEPKQVGIDPERKLVDRNREDNIADVKTDAQVRSARN